MHWTVKSEHYITDMAETLNIENPGLSCQKLVHDHPKETPKELAVHLYGEAFSHNLDGDWPVANAASACAAYLINGSEHWHVEAKDLVN